jgi:hypothetical protein
MQISDGLDLRIREASVNNQHPHPQFASSHTSASALGEHPDANIFLS